MELVYLWVEDYKNIHRQGFNFSARFRCNYNPKTNELTIEENKDYIPNFFGNNINITAIVGKNGSGKSSILFQEEGGGGQEWTKSFKIIFKNNILELIEPLNIYLDEEGPYVKVFKIINKTKYNYKKMTIYKSIDLNNLNIQYPQLQQAEDKKIDDNYGLYYDGDILKYLDVNKIYHYINENYGFSHKNPNSLTFFIKEDPVFDEDGIINEFQYAINSEPLERKIKQIINSTQYNFPDSIKTAINNNSIFSLSHGQRTMLIFIALLLNKIDELDKDLIIYLDEPDIALHPQWQKQLINNLLKLLSYKKNIKIHFVITTHSPFILSDIPKQNIIFLDTDKNGNCKVVDGLNNRKQTFGANIHTLLSDSFFMEDGLIGEFAKGKIESIRKFYNKVIKYKNNKKVKKAYRCFYEKKQKDFWDIQSIIGEPFLKTIAKNQLEEIELILFKDKAQKIQIQRYIEEYGADKIREILDGKA